jgi:hypothetical protein
MLKIKNWANIYENNRTRELKKLDWVPVPNKHDGDGYTELMDHPDGPAHFAAWMAIVQIASKCDVRGTLSREGARPHDARSFSRISRIPSEVFEAAIPRLLEIGWLENDGDDVQVYQQLEENPHEPAVIPQGVAVISQGDASSCAREKGREWKGMEGNGNTHQSPNGDCAERQSDPEPSSKPKATTDSERDEWFDKHFWPAVWAKIGIAEARKAFRRKARTVDDARLIVKAVKKQSEGIMQRAASSTNGTPIHPATWLNQERYRDEPIILPEVIPRDSDKARKTNSGSEYLLALSRGEITR